ncbi:MAG: hypothetical protein H8D46_04660 [FCB group bacterium]|nr:hypothetical protein [FCB group bacterium]
MFENEIVYHDDSTFHKSSGCGAFGKINFGSPILFNLVSFSWHVKAMYIEPESDSTHDITDGRMVFGYGNDIEFWLTKNSCATIGFTDERDTFSDDDLSDSLYPSKVRFVFGFKTYFNN